jgi:hypothetical protein
MKHPHSHIPFLVLALAVFATVAVLYAYIFYATSASVRQTNLARDAVKTERANQSQSESFLELASSTAVSRARLSSFFVPVDDVVVFITALESLGPQSGGAVSIASISADPAGLVRAGINAHGSWPSVMRVLSLAERMPYAVSVDHVRLDTSASDPASKRMWNLSFDIQAATAVPSPASP